MTKQSSDGWKTCSRGHRYRGPGGCPICWKGSRDTGRDPTRGRRGTPAIKPHSTSAKSGRRGG